MAPPSRREEIIEQIKARLGEVADHRAARWLKELEAFVPRSTKERLLLRLEDLPEELAQNWLKELDDRLSWTEYKKENPDFCYGVGFGVRQRCAPSDEEEACPASDICKQESEAQWPEGGA